MSAPDRRRRLVLGSLLVGSAIAGLHPASGRASETPAPREVVLIAFNSTRDGNYEVYVMEPDGSNPVNVSRDEATEWVYASYDGLLVMSSNRRGGYPRGSHDLYAVRPDRSEIEPITRFPVYDSYLGRSPDGNRFVVASRKDGRQDLYVIDAQGNEVSRLTNDDFRDGDPDWSPDGSRILFRSDRGGAMDLWTMSADGSNPRRLTHDPANDAETGYGGEGPGRFSPDGKTIAWMSFRGGNWEICLISAEGGDSRCVASSPGEDSYPSWSPDGKQVAFCSTREGNDEIYVMNADGSGLRRLTNHPRADQAPVWVVVKRADPAPAGASPLEPLAFLAGSCWSGKFPNGEASDEHCFTWFYGGRYLRDRHAVRPSANDYRGETIYAWDAEKKAIVYTYWASDGTSSSGAVEATADGLVFPGRHVSDSAVREMRSVWRRVSPDRYSVEVTERSDGGPWRERWRMTMERRKP